MKINILMTAMMLMLSVTSYSADEKAKTDASPSPKLYVIYVQYANQDRSYLLENVEGVDFNGVKCLKGRHADISWLKGKICYIPVTRISAMIEYDTMEQYVQDIQKYRDAQLK